MKKLLAFAMILSLGLFCAVGCNKPAPKKQPPAGGAAADAGKQAPAPAAKEAPKPEAKK
jgi:hypothetical protein